MELTLRTFTVRVLSLSLVTAACLALPAAAAEVDLHAADLYPGSGAGAHAHHGADSDYWKIAPRLELAIPLGERNPDPGPKLGIEALYAFGEIAPKLDLDAGARFSFSYLNPFSIFEIVPEARLSSPLSPKFALYGETGLGLGLITGGGSTDLSGVLRFAAGGAYALSPKVNLLVEPLGFNIYFKSGSFTTLNVALGLQFKE